MGLAGDVACLVGAEKDGERGYFLRPAQPAHGLALDKGALDLGERFAGGLRLRLDAALERRRFDGAGTNGVRPDALPDEIGGNRLGQSDDGSLAGAIGWFVLLVGLAGWETLAYVQEPRSEHPTLSSLTNAALDTHTGRALAFAAWLVGGSRLARR